MVVQSRFGLGHPTFQKRFEQAHQVEQCPYHVERDQDLQQGDRTVSEIDRFHGKLQNVDRPEQTDDHHQPFGRFPDGLEEVVVIAASGFGSEGKYHFEKQMADNLFQDKGKDQGKKCACEAAQADAEKGLLQNRLQGAEKFAHGNASL